MTDFSTITACGECCSGCSKKAEGSCPGCLEADGRVPEWAESGMCRIHACCREHHTHFCGVCCEFPCEKLPQMISWNPEIVQHLSALRDEYIIRHVSVRYPVRRLSEADIPEVLSLCGKNTLYYRYCPPCVSEQSLRNDMSALPPGKTLADKYYIGYFDGRKLIAVLDLILSYPDHGIAWIGFFMLDADRQNHGVGSSIISELFASLKRTGINEIRLGWVEGNPQAEHFWHKNGFTETGIKNTRDERTVVLARKDI